ncbi:MAG: ATP-binding cassette domain-containing protein [Candidatus Nomurabacteria bacterium]|jgi:ABC-2 type transport system ATP-binding protein|nr:ATP-binding cassette domain-containing protein [Candidatus Nomurabacteria bacterium]
MNSDIAVSIKNVRKSFRLPHEREDSIKMKVLNIFKKHDKGYDNYEALKGIDLDIKKGEFIGILGRNGAGKSTLLKIIAEIYQPTRGSIEVSGKLVPFIELGVGFNPNLSGRDNVYLNGAMFGFSRDEVDKMYNSIVDFAELEDFMDQKLKNYSSGMKVRLAFSVAIKANADILLLDEVLAVGDAAFKKKCYAYFNNLKANKKTIIFVTHGMGAVKEYCDRAVLLENGKVAFDGDPAEAADRYNGLFKKEEKKVVPENAKKDVQIKLVKINVTKKHISLNIDLKNNTSKTVDDIIFGVSCSRSGRLVGGFQSGGDKPFSVEAGSKETAEIAFDNIFGNGTYSIAVNLRDAKTKDIIDSLPNAVEFDNQFGSSNYFPVEFKVK